MSDGIEEVQGVISRREVITSGDENSKKIGIGSAHSGGGSADPFDDVDAADGNVGAGEVLGDDILPPGFPVQPLGVAGGKFYFLTARGELTEMSAGALSHRSSLVALMVGVKDPMRHLADIAEPGKRDTDFSAAKAGDKLMQACGLLPLFDRYMPIRHTGTWRGATRYPVVHLGENLNVNPDEDRRGRMVSGALYPAVPAIKGPAKAEIPVNEVQYLSQRITNFWNWQCDNAGDLIIAWIGQAVLGQYPDWRTHLWINGKNGSGKSTLLRIISFLLGGMSVGVKNSASAASIRQTTNRMAAVRIFDEAEKSENGGGVEDVIAMFRLMSGAEGAQMEKGTSDHSGIRFGLYGAGLLGSIIPGGMAPQDRSRFVMLTLGDRLASANPTDAAMFLDELEQDAKALGPAVWRRMLRLAPKRWDTAFRAYNALVQSMGGRSRDGDTIGTLLAGWDLMLFDEPLIDPVTDQARPERIERAKTLIQPLIEETQEADELGEGERLLNAIYGGVLHKEHGGVKTVAEEIMLLNSASHSPSTSDGFLLARLGLRLFGEGVGQKRLFVANAENSALNKALAGTRWRGGGHKAALQTIADVEPYPGTMRVAGVTQRGLVVPARLLPGYGSNPENGTDGGE
ncbi:hypothetical protein PhaeoP18_04146 (plasmid) [Phaeobacter piscinae]|uniref:hypothetical protein n=1 Tax=Phaeobacter piscinae TaxID=1580596 RepID=UPI000C9B4B61|nr:hypothetical protein [Phaeobacter piscinae]AUR38362.1 hypothetical protein PhaeoP18_04146 [Phaeobacter piscinae]